MTHKNAYEVLAPHQALVVEQRLREVAVHACPVVVSLSGSHAYGFPSPDSDVDVKAVHLDPISRFTGLSPGATTYNHVETFDGVEVDHTSNELGGVLRGVLQGNGNYVERVLGGLYFTTSTLLDEMQDILRRALSRRLADHYRGFARSQLGQIDGRRSVKGLLYVFRTLLTGTHVLRTGEVVMDLPTLLPRYGLEEVMSLVKRKRAGTERIEIEASEGDYWRTVMLPRAFAILQEAREDSLLPADPPNEAEVEAWLVRTRLLTA